MAGEAQTTVKADPIDDRDWSKLTLGEQIRQVEVEGYLVIPDMLTPEHIRKLKAETAKFERFPMDYSPHQLDRRLHPGPNPYPGQPWKPYLFGSEGGLVTELIAHPPMIRFLKKLMGEDLVFMTYETAQSNPGHPGISLHTDGQPYGSWIFGFECSCPVMVKVLYYLDDLTPDVSPFCVIPRSHLSMHEDANPYKRYSDHPDKVMITLKAGSACVIHPRLVHGAYANVGNRSREMLQIGYRPAWAGPVQQEVPEWDPEELAKLPASVRPLFGDRNQRQDDSAAGHKPADMATKGPGMSPSRWEQV